MIVKDPQVTCLHTREMSDFWPVAQGIGLSAPFKYFGFTGFDSRTESNPFNATLEETVMSSDELFISQRLVVVGSRDAVRAIRAARCVNTDTISLINLENQVLRVPISELGGVYE